MTSGAIQTTDSIKTHASLMTGADFETTGQTATISYTTIGAITTGATANGEAYQYAAGLQEDASGFAGDLEQAAGIHWDMDGSIASKISGGQ